MQEFLFFRYVFKNKNKKMTQTLFYYVNREIWLVNSKRVICINQSRFYIFSHPREFKNVKNNFKINISAFLLINHLQADSCIEQGIFLHVIPVYIIVPWSLEQTFSNVT